MSSQEEKTGFWRLHGFRVWTVIGFGVILLALLRVADVIQLGLITIAVTAVIVFTAHGVVNFFEERGIPRLPGTLLTFLIGLIVIAGFFALIIPAMVDQTASLITNLPGYGNQIANWARGYVSGDNAIITMDQVNDIIDQAQTWLITNAGSLLSNLSTGIVDVGAGIGNAALIMLISVIASLWLLIDLPKISVEFRSLFNESQQETLDIVTGSFGTAFYGWAKTTFVCAAINGVLCGIAFFIVGIPYSSLLGLACGVLYIVPYIGPMIAYVLCGVVGLTSSILACVLTVVINLVIHEAIVNILSPKLMKSSVNVHPALTLIGIIIGECVAGVMGMLLAVPIIAAAQTIFVTYFEASTGKSLYTADGALFQKTAEKPQEARVAHAVHNAADTLSHLSHRENKGK